MAEKPKKPQKLRARLPRGLEDRGPAAIAATRQMVEKIREVNERYGFEPVEKPAIEYTEALGNSSPTRTGRMRACFRSRTTTSNGSRCATT